ncbi:reverse transcriptase [Phytophthora megakarya]|uniref:Reverse transcriptase n=1 Tax=Phytophthora megakarya TaxID=4795 RepID=A0A225VCW7_9STRA|nr:reverse transcriptase [Phytophthora megakarya]
MARRGGCDEAVPSFQDSLILECDNGDPEILIGGGETDGATSVERKLDWNFSISVVKSFWGMSKVEYLGHKVSYDELEANLKDLSALTVLVFPGSLRAMQSFLGSLNYYSRFIEDYAIYASVMYELREIDFAAMTKGATQARIQQVLEAEDADQVSQEDRGVDHRRTLDLEAPDPIEIDPRWIHAHRSFNVLKTRIVSTPILRHFDPDRKATVVVYASDWAISGALMQEYAQIYHPVTFASRTLKSNELNYVIAEKEVLTLLTILDLNYNGLVVRPIHVLTRHTTLAWLFRFTALQGRLGQWTALLSPWTFEITKCVKREHEILGALAARITPSSEVDKALISIAPKKEPRRKIHTPIPTVRRDEDIRPRAKRGGGAYSAILWKFPEWRVLKARAGYAEGLTVNEAEYHGLLLCLDLLEDLDPRRLVICGDSNRVIRQVRHCYASELRTDYVLDQIMSCYTSNETGTGTSAVTTRSKARSGVRFGSDPDSLREEVVRELRIERIRQAQDEELWITGWKKYLVGEIRDLTQEEAKMFGSIAMNKEVDQLDLLFYCPTTKETAADRPVVPETVQQDILHHYHTSLLGGHQGIGRTYDRIRDHFHWRGLYKSVQRYVGECVYCETGKRRSRAAYPFQIIAMDHIHSLPRSFNCNTELLIFVDLFSGYVIAKSNASRSAQTIAETYEECVFRRFDTSEVIRHDREPNFTSDFFKSFNKILGQRQRATMAYRPQANGSAERMVQKTTRDLKIEIGTWDEYAERLTFAINTARYRIRGETPFYMIHDTWLGSQIYLGSGDPGTIEIREDGDIYYQQAREQVNQRLREAIADRFWIKGLVIPRSGYAKKLAHLWHGPFRVAAKFGEYAVNIFPVVHVSKIKLVKVFPDQPIACLNGSEGDRVDLDEALLPEDSWIH